MPQFSLFFFKGVTLFKNIFIYLFLDRGEGREKERERNINVWLTLTRRTSHTRELGPQLRHVP